MEVRKEVKRFAEAMEQQLQANDHKGGWQDCSLEWLAARLVQEAGELLMAIQGNAFKLLPEPIPGRVMAEAADVANFAMMIWDRVEI